MTTALDDRPEGFRRVAHLLASLGHPHAPVYLEVAARTAQEAADALRVIAADAACTAAGAASRSS